MVADFAENPVLKAWKPNPRGDSPQGTEIWAWAIQSESNRETHEMMKLGQQRGAVFAGLGRR